MTNDPAPAGADEDGEASSVPTLLERMVTVMGEDRARAWLAQGRVRVDGVVVEDPERPTPHTSRWLIAGS